MTSSYYKRVTDFEDALRPGDACIVRWTCSNRVYQGRGVVDHKNQKSIVVELSSEILEDDGRVAYFKGRHIKVPLLRMGTKWSGNNRVAPVLGE